MERDYETRSEHICGLTAGIAWRMVLLDQRRERHIASHHDSTDLQTESQLLLILFGCHLCRTNISALP